VAIEAYTISEQDGTHIPLDNGDRSPSAGEQESAPANRTSDLHAAEVPPGSAPAQEIPPPSPGLAAPGEGEEIDDDAPIPEAASLDYVQKAINRQTRRRRALERQIAADRQAAEQRLAQQQGQIEALTRMLAGAEPAMPPAPATPAGPPQAEQFDSHDA